MKLIRQIRIATLTLLAWVMVSCGSLRPSATFPIRELRTARATISDIAALESVDHPGTSLKLQEIADALDSALNLIDGVGPPWPHTVGDIAESIIEKTDILVTDATVDHDLRAALISLRAVLRTVALYAPAAEDRPSK